MVQRTNLQQVNIRKTGTTVYILYKIWRPTPSRTGSYSRQMKFRQSLQILKLAEDYIF